MPEPGKPKPSAKGGLTMPSLNHHPDSRKYRIPVGGKPRGEGPAAVREAFDLGSNDSAQKHIDRAFGGAIREAQILVLRPGADLSPIIVHVAHLNAMLETGPARPLNEALLKDGVVSRAQDEAREHCLDDAT